VKDPGSDLRQELRLAIDENNLLDEWKSQAAMMLDVGIRLADAMQEEDEARAALALADAEVDKAIRMDPPYYGVTKITETTVANAILQQSEHIENLEVLHRAKHAVRLLRAAQDALAHRKSSLQGMTDLWLRQWFADPKSSDQPAPLRAAAGRGGGKPKPARKRRRATE